MPSTLRSAVLLLLTGTVSLTVAQEEWPDTLRLQEARITAHRAAAFHAGSKLLEVDSTVLQRHAAGLLSDLLSDATAVFVKNYGPGSLATTAFRGGNANHTAVLWNGFDMGSPMNGQLDLSLVPVLAANAVSVQYGGASALWGSGAIGGAVHLQNLPRFDQGLRLSAGNTVGSFGLWQYQLGASIGNKRRVHELSVYRSSAQNDYAFLHSRTLGKPLQRQVHAGFTQQGLITNHHFRLGQHQILHLRYWLQENEREIPPTLLQEFSTAAQTDRSHRLAAEWQYTATKWSAMVRAAWFRETLDWYPREGQAPDHSASTTAMAEAEWRYRPANGHLLNLGINNTYAQAVADGYPEHPSRNRSALFASYRWQDRKRLTTLLLGTRQELVAGEPVPFTASLGADRKLAPGLTLRAQLARVYRIPTFNDLYWRPGGNPDLLPEQGYSAEAGAEWKWAPIKDRLVLSLEATAYQRELSNWIIWLPTGAYWSPRNIMEVRSRGLETHSTAELRLGKQRIRLALLTDHVVSVNRKARSAGDASVDKQLIYTPMYSGHLRLTYIRGRFSMTGAGHYVGYRYVSTDNRSYLEPYTLWSASCSYRHPLRGTGALHFAFHGDNLSNTSYEVMLSRPMPLRNFRFSLQLDLPVRTHAARPAP